MRIFTSLLLLLSAMLSMQVHATHITGGYLSWEYIDSGPDSGKFIFRFHFVRDCNSFVSPVPVNAQVQLFQSGTIYSLPLGYVSSNDVTDSVCGNSCANPTFLGREEYVLESAPFLLTPFNPNQPINCVFNTCCRSDANNLLNATSTNLYMHSKLYPQYGLNGWQFVDDSPLVRLPYTFVTCAGADFDWDPGMTDADGDSLAFVPGQVLGESDTVQWNNASYDQPFPGQVAVFDSTIGRWRYAVPSTLQGRFIVATTVRAFRCGQLVSETTVEQLIMFAACSTTDAAPSLTIAGGPVQTGPDMFEMNVLAGQMAQFSVLATDNGTMRLQVAGNQFASDLTDASGDCLYQPCATLSGFVPDQSVTSTGTTQFQWQTDCSHVRCGNTSTAYDFHFRYTDDHCPAPNVRSAVVRVHVMDSLVAQSPWPTCTRIASADSIRLRWTAATQPASMDGIIIYWAAQANGPFVPIDTVTNASATSYWHVAGQTPMDPLPDAANYYRIQALSTCDGLGALEAQSNLASIHLSIINTLGTVDLAWNALSSPSLPGTIGTNGAFYKVMREFPSGTWTQIAQVNTLSYSDVVVSETEVVNYRIEADDQMPCTSFSNVVGGIFSSVLDATAWRESIRVVPNPSNGSFSVQFPERCGNATLTILDSSGRQVQAFVARDGSTFRVSGLTTGVYLLRKDSELGPVHTRAVVY